MNSGQFTNTSSHMVQEVVNIIDAYKMGALRALAQEPVQNALDAVRPGQKTVAVEYRLLRRVSIAGEICHLLTVTDRGTTGLRGPIVSAADLEARNYQLKPEENWAAFEAQGYTKENEDALGSRGQGKAAFLYHSHVPGESRRMTMLYDTLLEDGEYRLGMRFARPVDQVMSPPLYDEAARRAIRGEQYALEGGLTIPLSLEPLGDIGTRIIVPHIDDELVAALGSNGELARFLQRCWWRAVQIGKLRIRVINEVDSIEVEIKAPSWWRSLPRVRGKPSSRGNWRDLRDGSRACFWGDIAFGDGHRIRRLVLLHNEDLQDDEIGREHPEYAGIQILRGSQWIETRGARQDFGDFIPRDKRPGFRGFVEFDRGTDSRLRAAELSQHDGFDARGKKGEVVRELRTQLDEIVREFSDGMGWEIASSDPSRQATRRDKTTHKQFLETFLNPNGPKANASSTKGEDEGRLLTWDCRLNLDYPDPNVARVDWGQSMRRVSVEVGVEPGEDLLGSADLALQWIDVAGKTQEIFRQKGAIQKQWGRDRVRQQYDLGDWQILRGKASRERQIECPAPGECQLRAVIEHRGARVKSAARTVYVQEEPPPPTERNAVTLSISAENNSFADKDRIDHGDVLMVRINARNRAMHANTCYLTATLADETLARNEPIKLEGTPMGDTPRKQLILIEKRQLLDPHQSVPLRVAGAPSQSMDNSSGVYQVRAELVDQNGESIAAARKRVYFQRDPNNETSKLPFDIMQKEQAPMWELSDDLTILSYSGEYPLYKEMREMRRQHSALQGRQAFIAEICANGLLEWALRPKEHGSDNNYDQLLDSIAGSVDSLWDAYARRLEKLGNPDASHIEFARAWRETVALMLKVFAKESA